jgi:hypothetical protein
MALTEKDCYSAELTLAERVLIRFTGPHLSPTVNLESAECVVMPQSTDDDSEV